VVKKQQQHHKAKKIETKRVFREYTSSRDCTYRRK